MSFDAESFLMGRVNFERTSHLPYKEKSFKLDRMQRLGELLGSPQSRLSIVHVAGSKGKGSTSTMITEILSSAGFSVGLFTSPHLQHLQERIAIGGSAIPVADFNDVVQSMLPAIATMDEAAAATDQPWEKPTFFEIMTAAALRYFEQQKVDFVVLEVGLGGRLDSTNIVDPLCSVITSISLDHVKQLGDTLELIAAEKAGIVKSQRPVISGVTDNAAAEVIRQIAKQRESPLVAIDGDFGFQSQRQRNGNSGDTVNAGNAMDYWSAMGGGDRRQRLDDIQIGMLGKHQAHNAAVSMATIEVLRTVDDRAKQISEANIRSGLKQACCRARIQLMQRDPIVILDAAHNEASIAALIETLAESFDIPREKRIMLFAATRGKSLDEMLERMGDWTGQLIVTKYQNNPRGCAIEKVMESLTAIQERISPSLEIHQAATPAEGWALAQRLADQQSLICVTGSFFLAAEIEALLQG